MTNSEQFAIDEWLLEYPKDATFDDILYLLLDSEDETIVPWVKGAMTRREIADHISGTETHFAFVTNQHRK